MLVSPHRVATNAMRHTVPVAVEMTNATVGREFPVLLSVRFETVPHVVPAPSGALQGPEVRLGDSCEVKLPSAKARVDAATSAAAWASDND